MNLLEKTFPGITTLTNIFPKIENARCGIPVLNDPASEGADILTANCNEIRLLVCRNLKGSTCSTNEKKCSEFKEKTLAPSYQDLAGILPTFFRKTDEEGEEL